MDIKATIDNSKMSWLQYTTVFICFLMNMLDGMDVLIISYTAPSIAEEWMVGNDPRFDFHRPENRYRRPKKYDPLRSNADGHNDFPDLIRQFSL